MASHMAYLPLVSSPVARKRYTSPTTAMVRPSVGLRITGVEGLLISSYSTNEGRLFSSNTHGVRPSRHQPHRNLAVPCVD